MKHAAVIVIGLVVLLMSPPARAESEAEVLFREALEDMRAANFVPACPKLKESQRLEPKSGTLISLGFCWEKLGKTASAWRTYLEAARLAGAEGREEYVGKAKRLAAQMIPRLARIRVVPPEDVEGLKVTVNGDPVTDEELAGDLFYDPGTITVVAQAPNRRVWTSTVELGDRGNLTVTIPSLEYAGGITLVEPKLAGVAPEPEEAPVEGADGMAIAGWSLVGVGAASTVVGLVLGGLVLGKKATVEDQCDPLTRACSPDGLAAAEDGSALSLGSTVTFVGGLALTGLGVTLVLLADDGADDPEPSVTMSLTPTPTGLRWSGRF